MARISKAQYKTALLKRYRDLKDALRGSIIASGVDYDDGVLREMRLIVSIARLHGVDLKETE